MTNNTNQEEKMRQDTATAIEQQHNVYVDAETEMYTHGEREDEYGWMPVPQEWIDEWHA